MKSFRRSAVGLVLAVGAWTALAAPASAGASTVTQWNVNATNALIGTAAMAPPVSMVHMAMVHGAIYDAVNGIDRSHRRYLVLPAAHRGTRWTQRPRRRLTASSSTFSRPSSPRSSRCTRRRSRRFPTALEGRRNRAGETAAAAMIAARTDDGRFGPFRFTVPATARPAWRPELPIFATTRSPGSRRQALPDGERVAVSFRRSGR